MGIENCYSTENIKIDPEYYFKHFEENINSGQYGASQIAFKENVRQLLADELIWDEL